MPDSPLNKRVADISWYFRQEFSRQGDDSPAFLFTDEGLGTRVKPEYIAYARKRFLVRSMRLAWYRSQ